MLGLLRRVSTSSLGTSRLISSVRASSVDQLWTVGSFPLVKPTVMLSTPEMLANVSNPSFNVFYPTPVELIMDMGDQVEYHADSVQRKRRKKMNKHKHKKRVKALRDRTKKN
ncbi:hypothetical protein THRCLA_21301 [Thraustotheca clavata]|uniref:Ribosomal protein mS38 C-terminal domain-containing protein n=1 Tax=Thraustotheca clavata TaxID=74557 RepID=A0A1V9ZXZ7_9STRA|nr:hypothetical protein THRCLA_21301 [Thraustotheca clavata]